MSMYAMRMVRSVCWCCEAQTEVKGDVYIWSTLLFLSEYDDENMVN